MAINGKPIKGRKLKKQPRRVARASTANGRAIQGMLAEHGLNPNTYKDYVAIVNSRILDWSGEEYTISNEKGEPIKGPPAVVHKRDLHKIGGSALASRFWHKSLNRRVVKRGPNRGK